MLGLSLQAKKCWVVAHSVLDVRQPGLSGLMLAFTSCILSSSVSILACAKWAGMLHLFGTKIEKLKRNRGWSDELAVWFSENNQWVGCLVGCLPPCSSIVILAGSPQCLGDRREATWLTERWRRGQSTLEAHRTTHAPGWASKLNHSQYFFLKKNTKSYQKR